MIDTWIFFVIRKLWINKALTNPLTFINKKICSRQHQLSWFRLKELNLVLIHIQGLHYKTAIYAVTPNYFSLWKQNKVIRVLVYLGRSAREAIAGAAGVLVSSRLAREGGAAVAISRVPTCQGQIWTWQRPWETKERMLRIIFRIFYLFIHLYKWTPAGSPAYPTISLFHGNSSFFRDKKKPVCYSRV